MKQHTWRHSGTSGRRNRTRGQALVEFAMVLPVFMVLLVGMLDAGFALYNKMTVINAAREGAHAVVAVDTTDAVAVANIPSMVTAAVSNAANGMLVGTTVACVAATGHPTPCKFGGGGAGTNALQGDSVRVTVTYKYIPLFPFLFGSGIDMDSIVQMVLDN
jgi:Flp pilus assembly protein TadG